MDLISASLVLVQVREGSCGLRLFVYTLNFHHFHYNCRLYVLLTATLCSPPLFPRGTPENDEWLSGHEIESETELLP